MASQSTKAMWREQPELRDNATDTQRLEQFVEGWQRQDFQELREPTHIARARQYWRLFYAPIASTTGGRS